MNITKRIFFVILCLVTNQALADLVNRIPDDLFLTNECQQFIQKNQNEIDHYWIEVPRDYSLEKSEKNKAYIFFYLPKKSNLKNPVLFFNGGPGFSSQSQYIQILSAAKNFKLDSQIDFIFMDQRGTGCSSPFPLGVSIENLNLIKSYGSEGIVRDAENIRVEFLKQQRWKIFGQSYGAYVVYRYLSLFPQSIEKAYAHGNALELTDEQRTENRIYSQKLVLDQYLSIYPDDKIKLFILKNSLANPEKCFTGKVSQKTMCGYEISGALVSLLGFKKYWQTLHSWIQLVASSNVISDLGLQQLVDQFSLNSYYNYHEKSYIFDDLNQMNISLNYLGLYDWDTKTLTEDNCLAVYKNITKTKKISESDLLLNECQAAIQFKFKDPIEPLIRQNEPNLKNNFIITQIVLDQIKKYKLKLYIYSGSLDCYVPQISFSAMTKKMGSSIKYKNFDQSGHDGFLTEKQIYLDLVN